MDGYRNPKRKDTENRFGPVYIALFIFTQGDALGWGLSSLSGCLCEA